MISQCKGRGINLTWAICNLLLSSFHHSPKKEGKTRTLVTKNTHTRYFLSYFQCWLFAWLILFRFELIRRFPHHPKSKIVGNDICKKKSKLNWIYHFHFFFFFFTYLPFWMSHQLLSRCTCFLTCFIYFRESVLLFKFIAFLKTK